MACGEVCVSITKSNVRDRRALSQVDVYEQALVLVREGAISVRKMRVPHTGSRSEEDFLAKVRMCDDVLVW